MSTWPSSQLLRASRTNPSNSTVTMISPRDGAGLFRLGALRGVSARRHSGVRKENVHYPWQGFGNQAENMLAERLFIEGLLPRQEYEATS
jgi:hypothetical protein